MPPTMELLVMLPRGAGGAARAAPKMPPTWSERMPVVGRGGGACCTGASKTVLLVMWAAEARPACGGATGPVPKMPARSGKEAE